MSISPPRSSKCGICHESLDKLSESECLSRLAEIPKEPEPEREIDPVKEKRRRRPMIAKEERRRRRRIAEERRRRRPISKNKKYAKEVLKQYNLKHKDAQYKVVRGLHSFPMVVLGPHAGWYEHINFLARPKNSAPDSQPQRFFAEFGYMRGSTDQLKVTECTILNMDPADPDDAPDDGCDRCFSDLEIFHPRNGEFIAGRMGPGSAECVPVGRPKW